MFTSSALTKAKIDLFNILSNYSYKDYYNTNFKNGKKKSKKHIPYSLSQETQEAQSIYNLVYGKQPEDITPDQEREIKYFLLPFRTFRTDYLKDAGGSDYYKKSI